MKGSLYRDRDYAFGQTILTLRTMIGLTQAGTGRVLGVTRKAVGEWEGGLTYPKAEHLKAFIALAIEQQAFPAGREAEEIRALWQAAHQKVLLDEAWLATLLPRAEALPSIPARRGDQWRCPDSSLPLPGVGHAWIGATRWTVTTFYGRE